MDQKIPTQVIDKNGKYTTVHKSPVFAPSRSRINTLSRYNPVITPDDYFDAQMMHLSTISSECRTDYPEAARLILDPYTASVTVQEVDGTSLHTYQSGYSSPQNAVQRSIDELDHELGLVGGYIMHDSHEGHLLIDFLSVDAYVSSQN